ncbi:MAG: hypothetical protein ACREJY_12210 [Candidatus Rokuibacteriota bacterium]
MTPSGHRTQTAFPTPVSRAATWWLVLALGLLGGLSGCGRYYWSKPNATAEQFDRDSRECAREASPTTTASLGVVDLPRYRGCLSGRGWTRDKQMEPLPPGWYRGIE